MSGRTPSETLHDIAEMLAMMVAGADPGDLPALLLHPVFYYLLTDCTGLAALLLRKDTQGEVADLAARDLARRTRAVIEMADRVRPTVFTLGEVDLSPAVELAADMSALAAELAADTRAAWQMGLSLRQLVPPVWVPRVRPGKGGERGAK